MNTMTKLELISNINELAEFMDAEATEWGRLGNTEIATVNGNGIMEQWERRHERKFLHLPMCVHALIYDYDDNVEAPAFYLHAFYFDDDGSRVKKPSDELERLATLLTAKQEELDKYKEKCASLTHYMRSNNHSAALAILKDMELLDYQPDDDDDAGWMSVEDTLPMMGQPVEVTITRPHELTDSGIFKTFTRGAYRVASLIGRGYEWIDAENDDLIKGDVTMWRLIDGE